jgi:hypothetical protein
MTYTRFIFYLIYATLVIALLSIAIHPKEVIAEPIPEEVSFSYEEGDLIPQFVIDGIIERHATGTKAYQMKRTIWCESFNHNVQSYVIDRRGHREESYGLVQIHLPSHPKVTKAQALDIEFAIKWMSDNWEGTAWYGYSRKLDKCSH